MGTELSEKETARSALRAVNSVSIRDNVEYGIVIYRLRNTYGAMPPFTSHLTGGLTEQDVLREMQARPKGSAFVAFAHTHGRADRGTFALIFSPEDIAMARRFAVNAYLATPNGEFVIYKVGGKDEFTRERL